MCVPLWSACIRIRTHKLIIVLSELTKGLRFLAFLLFRRLKSSFVGVFTYVMNFCSLWGAEKKRKFRFSLDFYIFKVKAVYLFTTVQLNCVSLFPW